MVSFLASTMLRWIPWPILKSKIKTLNVPVDLEKGAGIQSETDTTPCSKPDSEQGMVISNPTTNPEGGRNEPIESTTDTHTATPNSKDNTG